MLEVMTDGKLKNISILDLPAFGSTISRLDKTFGKDIDWQTQANFEILKNVKNNPLPMFEAYKLLIDGWKNYILMVYENESKAKFTIAMERNKFFNFTRHINTDIKTFLEVTIGSQLNARREPLPVWRNVAERLFENTKDNAFTRDNGVYDKLFLECLFRRNILNRKRLNMDDGTCESFTPMITTNGICHSFNGQKPSETWKESKIVTEFDNLFPNSQSYKYFHGSGDTEGKKGNKSMKFS